MCTNVHPWSGTIGGSRQQKLLIELQKTAANMARAAYGDSAATKCLLGATTATTETPAAMREARRAVAETPEILTACLPQSSTSSSRMSGCTANFSTVAWGWQGRCWQSRVVLLNLGPLTCAGECRISVNHSGRGICIPTVTLGAKGRLCKAQYIVTWSGHGQHKEGEE